MGKVLLILMTQMTLFASAQTVTYGSFKISEQEIFYQKVFSKDSVTAAVMEKYYKTLPGVSNLELSSDGVKFDINEITVDYRKFGISQVATPPIMQSGKYSGKVSIGIKDGKYRVTMKSIQMTGDIGYKKITEKENLTVYSTRNSATILSPDWCRPNMFGLLDQAFTDNLEFKGEVTEDW
ncbi:MAG: hypothetical protein JJE09_16040 [Bacteroidia bacterium]|nr:hypothetical protein [Bacteroidia bacterium]